MLSYTPPFVPCFWRWIRLQTIRTSRGGAGGWRSTPAVEQNSLERRCVTLISEFSQNIALNQVGAEGG